MLPVLFLALGAWRKQDSIAGWRKVIAPHLLAHLRVDGNANRRVSPIGVLLTIWVLLCVALAGPTWRQEPAPFADDTAALAIVLEVTPTMLATDIAPTRLERSVHKIRDLLELRPGTRTLLIAYAGSSHLVMPLTDDARIIESFAAELDPEILPIPGDAAADAVDRAEKHLAEADVTGSILLVTDGIDAAQVSALTDGSANRRTYPLEILAVGTLATETPAIATGPPAPAIELEPLKRVARARKGSVTRATVDDRDVRRLASRIESSLVISAQRDGGGRWRDSGYWLVPVLALLMLLWFRPGWTVDYS